MDNPSYEADEKGSVHLQSIKRIKEPDNLKVRQSNATYTNRSLNLQDCYVVFKNVIALIKLCQNQGDDNLENHVEVNMKHVNTEEEYGNNQVTMCNKKSIIWGVAYLFAWHFVKTNTFIKYVIVNR